jgi:hypothetical protein
MGWETPKTCSHEWGHGSLKGRSTVGFPERKHREKVKT